MPLSTAGLVAMMSAMRIAVVLVLLAVAAACVSNDPVDEESDSGTVADDDDQTPRDEVDAGSGCFFRG
ncbi:MAG: hypothetical protein M5R36_29610 [Deltaproteobacteria bacterium]|nr:hypothetical protein [Deltaproteobacteria bacterium]